MYWRGRWRSGSAAFQSTESPEFGGGKRRTACRVLCEEEERKKERKMELKNVMKDKKFWFASFLIAWAAALQGHMMWLQRQDSFKQKFRDLDQSNEDPQIQN